jgi:hypothetical protein
VPPSKRPSRDNATGLSYRRGIGGYSQREKEIFERRSLTRRHPLAIKMEILSQRAPNSSRGLWSFTALGFAPFMVNRCWIQFHGVCKVSRLLKMYVWTIFKAC